MGREVGKTGGVEGPDEGRRNPNRQSAQEPYEGKTS